VVGGSVIATGDPKTGVWREAALEWGNLTIMGRGYVGDNRQNPANALTPAGTNESPMEGLTEDFPGDPDVRYGGDDDDDDSGSILYASFRYAGRVIGQANELNGLSLGALGRETEVRYVEIMNNVDDGIEIWGGTFDIKYFTIWNIGDDSLDVDQGWRGRAQFGLIVQGYSVDASQGSGVGDNAVEIDGYDGNTAGQPVTACQIYNVTVIGQPEDNGGDRGYAARDNGNAQFRNCIFMDIGERVINNDGDDGDGSTGYGANGTLDFATRWTTPFTFLRDGTDGGPGPNSHPGGAAAQAALYQAQDDDPNFPGVSSLIEMTGTVFHGNNLSGGAYAEAIARGVVLAGGPGAAGDAAASNPALDNIVADLMPIKAITREALVVKGTRDMRRVLTLDPRAANDAASLVTAGPAPLNGFYTPANFRGAFGPNNNWALGWTAADAFGFYVTTGGMPQIDNPDATIDLAFTVVTFQTQAGVNYVIECTNDGRSWAAVGVVAGDGATKNVATELGGNFDSSAAYRVSAQ